MKVTIKMIAEIADVHRSTVDKVIHGRPGVSDEVREKIQGIIDELDYKPSMIGRALAKQNKPIRVAAILLKVDSSNELAAGMKRALEELESFGFELDIHYVEMDADYILSLMNKLIEEGIDGLILQAFESDLLRDKVNALNEKDIAVFTVNSDLSRSKRVCHVGQDAIEAGRVAGSLMGQMLNGQGKIAIISSSDTLNSSKERESGFLNVLNDRYKGLEVVEVIHTHEEREKTFMSALKLIKSVPDLSGIYITCGNVDEVGRAIKVTGDHNNLKMISHDMYPEVLKLVEEGIINFTLDQNLGSQGYTVVKQMFNHLFDPLSGVEAFINTPTAIIMDENM